MPTHRHGYDAMRRSPNPNRWPESENGKKNIPQMDPPCPEGAGLYRRSAAEHAAVPAIQDVGAVTCGGTPDGPRHLSVFTVEIWQSWCNNINLKFNYKIK